MAKTNTNVWMNGVSDGIIFEGHTVDAKGKDRSWYNIGVKVPTSVSKTGFANISVNPGQKFQATRRDGSAIDGMNNILLGKPDAQRKVSVVTKVSKKGVATYGSIQLTNAEIAEYFEADKKAYRAAHKAQATEEE